MKEAELVSAVRATSGIDSVEHGAAAVRATLHVLGQRLAGGETKDIAAQLPNAFADALPKSGSGEHFDLDEFYDRVGTAEGRGCSRDEARRHARAVTAALKVALTDGEFADLVSQLPPDYADLISTGPIHH